MKSVEIDFNEAFKVIAGNEKSQAAVMTLGPDESTGGPDNKHENSDQWLYVISGNGAAIINGKEVAVQHGALLLIEAGENHEIKNTGPEPLKTLNFYCPPAYS